MPTYEYKCDACGNEFEQYQSITAAAIKKCPKCGKNKVRRLIGTGAGVIFKGSGFYTTDYRSENYKTSAKADSGAGSGEKPADKAESNKAENKSGSPAEKPAAKAETAPVKKESKAEAQRARRKEK